MTEPAYSYTTPSEKAPDAYRTISEVAAELSLPQHVLRFWETRFSQIKPMKRGGGRRFYRPDDVALLKGIQRLLYSEGYTIRGVQKVLKAQGLRFVQSQSGVGEIVDDFEDDAIGDERPIDNLVEPSEPENENIPQSLDDEDEEELAEVDLPLFTAQSPTLATPANNRDSAILVDALRALREELSACRTLLNSAKS